MGKIFNNLPSLIKDAMKAQESKKLNAYKNVKAKLLEFKTSKEGAVICNKNNGEIPDANEIAVIKKYLKELIGDMETYKETNPTLYKESETEYNYLKDFVPAEASEEDIKKAVNDWVDANITDPNNIQKRMMGQIIAYTKSVLPNADGSLVAKVVNASIKFV